MMKKNSGGYQIHKFGGTSLANAHCLRALKDLLLGQNEVIVVSAMQGITSQLQALLDQAKQGQDFTKERLDIENFHVSTLQYLLPGSKQSEVLNAIQKDMSDINDILHAVLLTRSYSQEIQDLILGYGELWSAKILASYLSQYGNVLFLDASKVVFKYEKNGMICIDWGKSQKELDLFLHNKRFDQLVTTGFIASTLEGQRTTLGRNGSDFSGAIFAKLFKAKSLTIWTDVDGIYTADPNRVRSAFVIESLSYKEALELAYFGAKVLHPMTIAPLVDLNIPMTIKNSLNPTGKGTYISESSEESLHLIKGLSCIDKIALINIEGAGMTGVSGVASRVFQILHQANISVILIAQASSEHSICFAVANIDSCKAITVLNENLQFEIERRQIEGIIVDPACAILSAVGDKMVGHIGISGKLCNALAKANINIRGISQGSSERNISVVINSAELNKALQAVHAGFYLSPKSISIGIIGPGQVGSTLLKEVHKAIDNLHENYQVNLLVRGIMNSRKMLLSHRPIDLADWKEALQESQESANLEAFIKHILADDVPHAVIIDCTANPAIAKQYEQMFAKGIHVITPNKHANAGDLDYYKKLQSVSRLHNTHYLYEATVCAGLPIINTLQDLIKTGDRIDQVEGVVSGTLSYIFSELANHKTFSEAVIQAKQLGYTEPDPREDLAGNDVARKLVCLAREIGFDVTLADVQVHNLVPESLRGCSVDEFLQKLPAYDEQMDKIVAKARENKAGLTQNP